MEKYLLIVAKDGYGKRTPVEEFGLRRRGTKGVFGLKGEGVEVAGVVPVGDRGQVVVVTTNGMFVRLSVDEVSVLSRAARGVKVVELSEGDSVASVVKL